MVSTRTKTGLFMGFGSGLVVIGAVLVIFWPPIFMSQLRRLMTLAPRSISYSIWQDIPIPMYLEFFMFNITNTEDILAGKNVSIHVEQLGPYVYREFYTKENITWNDNSTVTFYNKKYWHFQPEMSNGSISDVITSINPIIATVAHFVRFQHNIIKVPVDVFLRMFHDNLFLKANVSAWLFDGIDDPVLNIASHFPDLPINIPYDKFGWFYDRNGSEVYDGSFIMNTGETDFSQLGNVEMWQFSNRTQYRDECGMVKGSMGELWAPELGQPEVTVFAADICTYLILHKEKDISVNGLEGVKYSGNDSLFDNGHNYPHTACYCDEVRDWNCMPPGALNVSSCRFGAPAFVTLPHFYNSDPYYPSKIDGLDPKEDMNFHLSLEMFTGMPLDVAAQLQINLLIRHVSAISINNQLPDPDTLVPMFWFRQEVQITDNYVRLARVALRLRYWTPYALYVLTVIGIGLLIAGITHLVRNLLKSPDNTPILEETQETQ